MNSTIEMILKRRSVRKYNDMPITEAEKDIILKATIRAPTAGAMMLYSIIEVEDQMIKEKLSISCDNQPFIAKAPYVLLFLADYQRWVDLYNAADCVDRAIELDVRPRLPEEGDLVLAIMDALIAAQTAALTAESIGIGSCYIGDIIENWETHKELFNLPQYTFPIVLLCFGKSAEKSNCKLKPRFDKKFILHKNRYRRFSKAELNEMHLPFGSQSFDLREYPNGAQNIVQANYFRKFTAKFSREMTRSTKLMIQSWCEKKGME